MSKKILVVGGVAGGASVASRLRRLSETDEIIMFEKGPDVSFSNCSLPYYLSDVVKSKDELLVMTPEKLKGIANIDVRNNTEVVSIDRENKTVTAKDVLTGEEYQENYNKLVLSPGANPIVPPFEGLDKANAFTIRNVDDIENLKTFITKDKMKHITVIGGGFIGVETAENLAKAGFFVHLVEAAPQIMTTLDYDMAQFLQKEIIDQNIRLIVKDPVAGFEEERVILESGQKIKAEAVVMAIGVKPDNKLAQDAGLEIGNFGGIKVDQNYLTNDEDIYAIGDAVEKYFKLAHRYMPLALAGPAQREARKVADHINNRPIRQNGVIGSSIIQVFDMNAASTGLTEGFIEKLDNFDINYDSVVLASDDKVSNMPDYNMMFMKLVYEVPTGRVLGAQAIGKGNVKSRIDTIATLISLNGTVYDLADLELTYAPPFGTAKDVVNMAGLTAANKLEGFLKTVPHTEIEKLVEKGAFIIDCRGEGYEAGHVKGAVSIPTGQVRNRMDEIPKDEPVYIYCKMGKNSYYVYRMLANNGYTNIYTIEGGYSFFSYYAYYNDYMEDRESILTEYNFN